MPARHICDTEMRPEPKTIAFGGVATGNMKAQLAAIAAGTISIIGSTFKLGARAAKMGIKVAVVAVLLVSSVRTIIIATISKIKTRTGTPARPPI